MDGVAVILALLAEGENVTKLVAPDAEPERISGDALAEGVTFPALRATLISSIDRNILSPGMTRMVTQRVQVEAHAGTVPEMKALIKAVRSDCADRIIAEMGGLTNITVHTDGRGPDGISADTGARMATQDFKVTFNEER